MTTRDAPPKSGRVPPLPGPSAALVITGVSVLLLVSTVFLGAVGQVGVQRCAVCTGTICTGSEVCPESVVGLVALGILLAIEAFFVSWGLSARAMAKAFHPATGDPEDRQPAGSDLLLHVLGPFFGFFGWALMALGVLLATNVFAFCTEACEFDWQLSGYPELLVFVGAGLLTGGATMLAILWIRLRRSAQGNGRHPVGRRGDPNR